MLKSAHEIDLSTMNDLIALISNLIWPATLLFVGWYLRADILGLLKSLRQQLASGASLKYREFEFLGIPIGGADQKDGSGYKREPAEDDLLENRNATYGRQRNHFVVHRVKPTGEVHKKNGLPTYDVLIYLISHKGFGAINDISRVEYYFGYYFGRSESKNGTKYVVSNGNEGFAVKVNAYGPMLCEARIVFHDGSEAITNRYLDFEGTGYKFDPKTLEQDSQKLLNRVGA